MRQFTAVVGQSDGWWIGWIEQVPGVNCQERTREDLLESLRTTLREALEAAPSQGCSATEVRYEREPIYV